MCSGGAATICRRLQSGRWESNPHVPYGTTDFRTHFGFRRPVRGRVRGLDSAFVPASGTLPVESLHVLPRGSFARRCLARGAGVSPSLRSSTSGVAAGALKLSTQVRSVCRSATPGDRSDCNSGIRRGHAGRATNGRYDTPAPTYPVRPASPATMAISSAGSTGFATCIWKPASTAFTRSSARAYAVSASDGTWPPRSGPRARTRRMSE